MPEDTPYMVHVTETDLFGNVKFRDSIYDHLSLEEATRHLREWYGVKRFKRLAEACDGTAIHVAIKRTFVTGRYRKLRFSIFTHEWWDETQSYLD